MAQSKLSHCTSCNADHALSPLLAAIYCFISKYGGVSSSSNETNAKKNVKTIKNGYFDEENEVQQTCVVTIGCFDLFHHGHKRLLDFCKKNGDRLVAIVHDDKSIFKNKKILPNESLDIRMNNVRPCVDRVEAVYDADPTRVLSSVIEDELQNYRVVYIRGNDWTQFPGRDWLDANDIPIMFHGYTKSVSSTRLREAQKIQSVFTPSIAVALNYWHMTLIYEPLKRVCLTVAKLLYMIPFLRLSANLVTTCSLLMVFPMCYFVYNGFYLYGALSILMHDFLDRLDGACAVYDSNERTEEDKRFGAFFDAQVDKTHGIIAQIFLIHFILGINEICKLFLIKILLCLMVLKIVIQISLFTIRVLDYFYPEKGSVVKARGEGKLATCAENISLSLICFGIFLGNLWFIFMLSIIIMLISIDMGIRSFTIKYLNRYKSSKISSSKN